MSAAFIDGVGVCYIFGVMTFNGFLLLPLGVLPAR
jgi:hypothetical protein